MEWQVEYVSVAGLPVGYKLTSDEEQDYLIYQLIAMVVETCKMKWGIDGKTIYKRLRDCGAIAWLVSGYDCLHTQSMDYIISGIEEMIESCGEVSQINAN